MIDETQTPLPEEEQTTTPEGTPEAEGTGEEGTGEVSQE